MGVEVSLVLTKCDLISDKRRSYLLDKFEKWGYQVITLNLQKSVCFKNLLAELKQKECSIFMGPSGVGKTTLLNMIIPGLQNSTSPVSNKIKRGKILLEMLSYFLCRIKVTLWILLVLICNP